MRGRLLLSGLLLMAGCLPHWPESSRSTASNSEAEIDATQPLCSHEAKLSWLHRVMSDRYLWYREVPQQITLADYATPEALLEALRYRPRDRWSYLATTTQVTARFEQGRFIGWGIGLAFDAGGRLWLRYVEPYSPAAYAGFARGDEIIAINGEAVTAISARSGWDALISPEEIGYSLTFSRIRRSDGVEVIQPLAKDQVTTRSVLSSDLFTIADRRVGYLVLQQFITPTIDELQPHLADLVAAEIDEMVVDLRYNSGGYMHIAQQLASSLYGENRGEVLAHYRHNDRYRFWDSEERLWRGQPQRFNLPRLIFLTSSATCSASEAVINGLRPYLDVVVIGSATCGKPVGMYGHDFCDLHFAPIELSVENGRGEGAYYDGLTPTCWQVERYPLAEWGDWQGDPLLATTAHWLEHGSCPATATAQAVTRAAPSEATLPRYGWRQLWPIW
jgi:carboxyl-terminal processing protease